MAATAITNISYICVPMTGTMAIVVSKCTFVRSRNAA